MNLMTTAIAIAIAMTTEKRNTSIGSSSRRRRRMTKMCGKIKRNKTMRSHSCDFVIT